MAQEAAEHGHLRGPGRRAATSATTGAVTVSVEEEDIATAEGTAAGEYAAEMYGDEPIEMVITDYPSIESLVARADMIESSFLAVYPDAEFLPRILGGTAENGVTSMETALQANPTSPACSASTTPATSAPTRHSRPPARRPTTCSSSGSTARRRRSTLIDEGRMYKGCVDTNPVGTGELAVNAFAKWLAGGTVPGIIEVPVFVHTAEG